MTSDPPPPAPAVGASQLHKQRRCQRSDIPVRIVASNNTTAHSFGHVFRRPNSDSASVRQRLFLYTHAFALLFFFPDGVCSSSPRIPVQSGCLSVHSGPRGHSMKTTLSHADHLSPPVSAPFHSAAGSGRLYSVETQSPRCCFGDNGCWLGMRQKARDISRICPTVAVARLTKQPGTCRTSAALANIINL